MKETLRPGTNKVFELKNKSFRYIELYFDIVQDGGLTYLVDDTQYFDLSKVSFIVKSKQAGVQNDYSMSLDKLAAISELGEISMINQYGYINLRCEETKPAADITQARVKVTVDMGNVVNLKGGDFFNLTVNVALSTFVFPNVDPVASSIMLVIPDAIGYQEFITLFEEHSIAGNSSKFSQDLGDEVETVLFYNNNRANYGNVDVSSAGQLIERFELNSDKGTFSEDGFMLVDELVNIGAKDPTIRLAIAKSRVIHDGSELNRCRIDMTLASANIVASENYLLVRKTFETPGIIDRTEMLESKHYAQKIGEIASKYSKK